MLRNIKRRFNNAKEGDFVQAISSSSALEPSGPGKVVRNVSFGRKPRTLAEQQRHLDETILSHNGSYLQNFDACIEACDALAATATSSLATNSTTLRRDPQTGLLDCSVLVSPDGDLLLIPTTNNASQSNGLNLSSHNHHQDPNNSTNGNHATATSATAENNNLDGSTNSVHSASNLSTELGDEYESAIYVGHDLDVHGDRALNGFSANGWSLPATSLALRQTEQSLHDMADFCEEIVLSKKEAASKINVACDKLRAASFERGPIYPNDLRRDAQLMKCNTNVPFDINQHRVGPMLYNGGTLHAAQVAVEEFYAREAEAETSRWRLASMQRKGALPALRKSATLAQERSSNRQKTLREMYGRVQLMQDHLMECQRESRVRWREVEIAEERVSKLVEERMLERSRLRENQRLEEFHQQAIAAAASRDAKKNGENGGEGDDNNGTDEELAPLPNAAEIWDIVSQVTESMESGSFEPISFHNTQEISQSGSNDGGAAAIHQQFSHERDEPHLPSVASRMDIEDEVGLPELRTAAFAADRAVRAASGSLLNVLSSLDQVRRSARISAESNMLSACNAQAACIRSIVKLERAAAEERLKQIEEMEKFADKIDVRQDLDNYIYSDRKLPGGTGRSFFT